MDWIVETSKLKKTYDGVKAVDGINLKIRKGEVFGFLGPNGAGKTTTILMLLGLTVPTSGQARVFGYDATRKALEVKRRTGYLPENVGFYGDLTAKETLAYITRLNGIVRGKAGARIEEILSLVGLSEVTDKEVGKFSRGMLQRLGIAATLVKEPKLVILDEPTLGVDPEGIKQIIDLIKRMKEDGNITILLCSHLLHHVQRICDRMGIISQGKMMVEGSVDELRTRIMKEGKNQIQIQVSRLTSDLIKSLKKIRGVEVVEESGNSLNITCAKDLRLEISKAIAENGVFPLLMKTQDYTLEEIYVRYFAER